MFMKFNLVRNNSDQPKISIHEWLVILKGSIGHKVQQRSYSHARRIKTFIENYYTYL